MPLTHRKARRRVGTRTVRRANMNGKVIGSTSKGRAIKRRNPRPMNHKNINRVAELVRESMKPQAPGVIGG